MSDPDPVHTAFAALGYHYGISNINNVDLLCCVYDAEDRHIDFFIGTEEEIEDWLQWNWPGVPHRPGFFS